MILMENPVILLIAFLVFIILNIYTIRDILKNKSLNKRQKNNYIWLPFGFPLFGPIIYFSEKKNHTAQTK